jgi:hypothetical protein
MLVDRELDHLPPGARWREWMHRVESAIFAASEPAGRETLARIVGKSCSIELLIDDIREDCALAGRVDAIAFAGGAAEVVDWKSDIDPTEAECASMPDSLKTTCAPPARRGCLHDPGTVRWVASQ